jgi:hypothetical protein
LEGKLLQAVDKAWEAFQSKKGKFADDISLRTALAEFGWEEPKDKLSKLAEWNMIDEEYGKGLERMSVSEWLLEDNDIEFGEEEFFITDQRGFNCILEDMLEELNNHSVPMHMEKRVKRIIYEPNNV